jgi:phosphohistidine phosphatase
VTAPSPTRRRIVLLRHAKAVPHDGDPDDHARALTERGRHEAALVARALAERGWTPDFVSASDSARTTETLACARAAWPGVRVEHHRSLYLTGLTQIRGVARSVPEDVTTWLVLGHNPGWEEAVHKLTGKVVELGTANAALLEGHGDSVAEAIAKGASLELVSVVRPD